MYPCVFCLELVSNKYQCNNIDCIAYETTLELFSYHGIGMPTGSIGGYTNFFYKSELVFIPKEYYPCLIEIVINEYADPRYMFGIPTNILLEIKQINYDVKIGDQV